MATYASQTNTRDGDLPFIANETLTSKEGYLAKLVNDSDVCKAALPDDVADRCLFVIIEGAAAGSKVTLRPLDPRRNVRIKLKGTCDPGDVLVMAAIDGTYDGMIEKLGSTADEYHMLAVAEEKGVDGQLLRCRPLIVPRYFNVGRYLGPLAADPTSPDAGDTWFNTAESAWKGYNGTDTVIFQVVAE